MIIIIIAIIILITLSNSSRKNNKNNRCNHYYYQSKTIQNTRNNNYYAKEKNRSQRSLKEKRQEFEQMKQTDFFKKWKKAQYRCQDGKCAYCQSRIDLYSVYTQVDHIKPLCKYGTNEYNNLVLACKECNYYCKKGNYIWRDAKGKIHNGWIKPNWIKENYVLKSANINNTNYTYK